VWLWPTGGELPSGCEAPVAAFFVAGRGALVTRNAPLRVSVLDFRKCEADRGPRHRPAVTGLTNLSREYRTARSPLPRGGEI